MRCDGTALVNGVRVMCSGQVGHLGPHAFPKAAPAKEEPASKPRADALVGPAQPEQMTAALQALRIDLRADWREDLETMGRAIEARVRAEFAARDPKTQEPASPQVTVGNNE